MAAKEISVVVKGWDKSEFRCDIRPNQSITITVVSGRNVGKTKIFQVGEQAEHGSYNLSYYGPITGIGQKTVSIQDYQRTKRLSLTDFAARNWDFDLAETRARNSEAMLYL